MSLFSILFSFCVILTGYFSKNKYAMLGAIRASLLTLNLELLMGFMILNVTLFTNSFSFLPLVILQENI
jgi:NADH-quinone oxidoreductase subunit H